MFLHDLVFTRQHVGPINLQPAHFKSQFRGIFEMIVNVGVVQQHFGWNTADVQAGPAEVRIFFYYDRLQSQLSGTNGRYIPARSAAYNRHIVLSHSILLPHGSSNAAPKIAPKRFTLLY